MFQVEIELPYSEDRQELSAEFGKSAGLPDGWAMFGQIYQVKKISTDEIVPDEYVVRGRLVEHEKAVRILAILEEK